MRDKIEEAKPHAVNRAVLTPLGNVRLTIEHKGTAYTFDMRPEYALRMAHDLFDCYLRWKQDMVRMQEQAKAVDQLRGLTA